MWPIRGEGRSAVNWVLLIKVTLMALLSAEEKINQRNWHRSEAVKRVWQRAHRQRGPGKPQSALVVGAGQHQDQSHLSDTVHSEWLSAATWAPLCFSSLGKNYTTVYFQPSAQRHAPNVLIITINHNVPLWKWLLCQLLWNAGTKLALLLLFTFVHYWMCSGTRNSVLKQSAPEDAPDCECNFLIFHTLYFRWNIGLHYSHKVMALTH